MATQDTDQGQDQDQGSPQPFTSTTGPRANSILVEYRKHLEADSPGDSVSSKAWLNSLEMEESAAGNETYSPDEWRHARAVLERLQSTHGLEEGRSVAPVQRLVATLDEIAVKVNAQRQEGSESLFTRWASLADSPPEFDSDQVLVEQWASASPQRSATTLEERMTLADAEELIAIALEVASEHEARARRARALTTTIATRLAKANKSLLDKDARGERELTSDHVDVD